MNADQVDLQDKLAAAEAAFNEANADRAALIVLCAGLKDSFKNIPMAAGLSPLDMSPLDALLAAHLRPEIVAAIDKLTAETRPR
jgi:hypothetical protein